MPDLPLFAFLLALAMGDLALRSGRGARFARAAARPRGPLRIAALALALCAAALAVGAAL